MRFGTSASRDSGGFTVAPWGLGFRVMVFRSLLHGLFSRLGSPQATLAQEWCTIGALMITFFFCLGGGGSYYVYRIMGPKKLL